MTVSIKKKRATIRDVGRRAIAELGFHPNHVARSLARRKTFTVGVVMGDVASPFFPDVVRGAEDVLAPLGYSLFLTSSRRDPEVERRNSSTCSTAAPTG
jgi:LacI family transcriptional regulator